MLKIFILRTERQVQALNAFISQNWRSMADSNKPMVCELKEEKAKRSNDQNKHYWKAVLQQIEEQAWVEGRQYSAEVWHECAKRRFLGLVDLPGGGHMAISTTTLSTKEFAEYVQRVESWAAMELGVSFVENIEPIGRIA